MRKALIGLLDVVRRVQSVWMRMRGQTPEGIAEQRIVSGQSWEEFCDTLKAAGASLRFPGAPRDPFNQAEGYRYLSRLVRAGLEGFLEDADPRAPVLQARRSRDREDGRRQSRQLLPEREHQRRVRVSHPRQPRHRRATSPSRPRPGTTARAAAFRRPARSKRRRSRWMPTATSRSR